MIQRPKPPAESKAALMEQVTDLLQCRFPDPRAAIEYALNYFTAVDLQGIRDNLRKGD